MAATVTEPQRMFNHIQDTLKDLFTFSSVGADGLNTIVEFDDVIKSFDDLLSYTGNSLGNSVNYKLDTVNVGELKRIPHALGIALSELFTELRDMQPTETTPEQSHTKISEYLCQSGIVDRHVPTDTSGEHSIIEEKKVFEREKNKMITFSSKNTNIQKSMKKNLMTQYLLLFFLILFMAGLSTAFFMGKKPAYSIYPIDVILITVSLSVMVIFMAMDLYKLFSKSSVETFNTDTPSPFCPLPGTEAFDILDRVKYFLDQVVDIHEVHAKLTGKESEKQLETIQALTTDYYRANYLNMRNFQLTDYKINSIKNNTNFIKWGFFVVSVIGIFSGLHVRGDKSSFPISGSFLICISFTLICLYLTIFLLHKKQSMIRKRYDWDKMYWRIQAIEKNQKKSML
jgi:hypothetical protein